MRIIIIGLDNAGKTTILCMIHYFSNIYIDRLHLDEIVPTVPSKYHNMLDNSFLSKHLTIAVGFNVETVTYKNLKF